MRRRPCSPRACLALASCKVASGHRRPRHAGVTRRGPVPTWHLVAFRRSAFSRRAGESRGAGCTLQCKGLTSRHPTRERNLRLLPSASGDAAFHHFRRCPTQKPPASNFRPSSWKWRTEARNGCVALSSGVGRVTSVPFLPRVAWSRLVGL